MKFWKSALLYAATVCTLTAVSCSDETKEPNLYTTAVTDDGNGTAKAAPASAAAGETITLTATPKENFSFAKWTVVSGDAELKSATANPTTFTMPEGGGKCRNKSRSHRPAFACSLRNHRV
mgnify:FL=1